MSVKKKKERNLCQKCYSYSKGFFNPKNYSMEVKVKEVKVKPMICFLRFELWCVHVCKRVYVLQGKCFSGSMLVEACP